MLSSAFKAMAATAAVLLSSKQWQQQQQCCEVMKMLKLTSYGIGGFQLQLGLHDPRGEGGQCCRTPAHLCTRVQTSGSVSADLHGPDSPDSQCRLVNSQCRLVQTVNADLHGTWLPQRRQNARALLQEAPTLLLSTF